MRMRESRRIVADCVHYDCWHERLSITNQKEKQVYRLGKINVLCTDRATPTRPIPKPTETSSVAQSHNLRFGADEHMRKT